jgi:DNA-binding NarL/FixJ family response regulator
MNEIRVGLVDDHSIVRQGLRAMLDRQPDLRVVGGAAAALAMVAQARPDVVLLDLKLSAGSDCDGLRVCAAVTERFPGSRVLVLATFADEWLVLEAIKQGAKGFLVKDVEITELVRGSGPCTEARAPSTHAARASSSSGCTASAVPALRTSRSRPGSGKSSPCSPAG